MSIHELAFLFQPTQCVMAYCVIDWLSLVTVRAAKSKTVSSDYLFRGNQASINYALLTLSELLSQVINTEGPHRFS